MDAQGPPEQRIAGAVGAVAVAGVAAVAGAARMHDEMNELPWPGVDCNARCLNFNNVRARCNLLVLQHGCALKIRQIVSPNSALAGSYSRFELSTCPF